LGFDLVGVNIIAVIYERTPSGYNQWRLLFILQFNVQRMEN
jgi:hypothetical protein